MAEAGCTRLEPVALERGHLRCIGLSPGRKACLSEGPNGSHGGVVHDLPAGPNYWAAAALSASESMLRLALCMKACGERVRRLPRKGGALSHDVDFCCRGVRSFLFGWRDRPRPQTSSGPRAGESCQIDPRSRFICSIRGASCRMQRRRG